jgi:hypothetical protein
VETGEQIEENGDDVPNDRASSFSRPATTASTPSGDCVAVNNPNVAFCRNQETGRGRRDITATEHDTNGLLMIMMIMMDMLQRYCHAGQKLRIDG